MFFIVLICLALHPKPISSSDDYWADDFDENKNCEKEDLLKKLSRQKNPGRCSFARRGNFLNLLFQSKVRDEHLQEMISFSGKSVRKN